MLGTLRQAFWPKPWEQCFSSLFILIRTFGLEDVMVPNVPSCVIVTLEQGKKNNNLFSFLE